MGYMHITNLYRDTQILELKRVYALEKIHGTSAHIKWDPIKARMKEVLVQGLTFFSGGESHARFVTLFNQPALAEKFEAMAQQEVAVYGEAYGGKQQGMKATYGDKLRFVVFDVKIGDKWLSVPQAEKVALELGLEFVHYKLIDADMEQIDSERDADSVQAQRNGTGSHKREGIVLRPPFEITLNNGSRLMAKHKRDNFRETKTPRRVGVDPEVLTEARAIADEWVTPMRFTHVLDKLKANGEVPDDASMQQTPIVMRAMIADVLREGEDEFEVTKAAKKAIGDATLVLWKSHVMQAKV
jgi:hypothetical protein